MTLIILDNLYDALIGDEDLCELVDDEIYKNKSIEKSTVNAKDCVISCEFQNLSGQIGSDDPILIVDIRTRKGTAGDKGAEYCAEIADRVRAVLTGGFTGAEVTKIQGQVLYDKIILGYRCRLEVVCHNPCASNLPIILSLTPSIVSPQPPGLEIELICAASSPIGEELQYKFKHKPPGASYWKDLSFWITQNWIRWTPKLSDSGSNSLSVDVIDGKHAGKGSYDATTTITFTVAP